jgi:hypothetical protein
MRSSPNRLMAIVVGAAYLLIGIGGFAVTVGLGFTAVPGGLLFGLLEVNALHNIVHVLLGAALLLGGLSSAAAAKAVNPVIGAACLVLGLVGLFIVGSPFNILAINGVGNVLHFGTAVLLLAAGLGAERTAQSP